MPSFNKCKQSLIAYPGAKYSLWPWLPVTDETILWDGASKLRNSTSIMKYGIHSPEMSSFLGSRHSPGWRETWVHQEEGRRDGAWVSRNSWEAASIWNAKWGTNVIVQFSTHIEKLKKRKLISNNISYLTQSVKNVFIATYNQYKNFWCILHYLFIPSF